MLEQGCTMEQVAAEMGTRWGYRPRQAWRYAYGWTQEEVADRYNRVLEDSQASMTGKRICDYEAWPHGGVKTTLATLSVLAKVYTTSALKLVDQYDRDAMNKHELITLESIKGTRFDDNVISAKKAVRRDGRPSTSRGSEVRAVRERSDQRLRLVVFPFTCPPKGCVDSYLVSGFCDDIVARLSKLGNIRVIPPASVSHLRPPNCSPVAICDEFSADAVIIGSLREFAETLLLHTNLVDQHGTTIWAERYSFSFSQLESMQLMVAASVADSLRIQLSPRDRLQLVGESVSSAKAYEFYLRGNGMLASNEEREMEIALGMINSAVQISPRFADAHAARGYALWRKYFSGWNSDFDTLNLAIESANLALQLDPTCLAAKMTMIRICWDKGWHEKALEMGVSALKTSPGSLEAMLALARAYNNAGMAEQALPLTRQILRIDKANPTASKLLIWNYLMAGDPERAGNLADKYLRLQPHDSNTCWAAALSHLCLSDHTKAIAVAKQGLSANNSDSTLWALLGYIHRIKGDEESAQAVWAEGIDAVSARMEGFEQNYRVCIWLANMEACAGHRDAAIERIHRTLGVEPHNSYLLYRAAHVFAELTQPEDAIFTLRRAVDAGFLSVQIMRHEERFGLRNLVDDRRYLELAGTLEVKVAQVHHKYPGPQGLTET